MNSALHQVCFPLAGPLIAPGFRAAAGRPAPQPNVVLLLSDVPLARNEGKRWIYGGWGPRLKPFRYTTDADCSLTLIKPRPGAKPASRERAL